MKQFDSGTSYHTIKNLTKVTLLEERNDHFFFIFEIVILVTMCSLSFPPSKHSYKALTVLLHIHAPESLFLTTPNNCIRWKLKASSGLEFSFKYIKVKYHIHV